MKEKWVFLPMCLSFEVEPVYKANIKKQDRHDRLERQDEQDKKKIETVYDR